MRIVGYTDIGKKRPVNEDSFLIYSDDDIIYGIVADGMGGHTNGDIASKMAVGIIDGYIKECFDKNMDYVEVGEVVRHAFIEANYRMYKYARENGLVCNMGSTATFAAIYMNKLITIHVGDSRVYSIDDNILQLTKDHTYVQELVKRGEISKEEAKTHPRRNFITRAMGTEETVKIDVGITDYKGEYVLICSDGLTEMVTDNDLLGIISDNTDIDIKVRKLVNLANENGGKDNITAVLFGN